MLQYEIIVFRECQLRERLCKVVIMRRKKILCLLVICIGLVNSIYAMQQSDNVVAVTREILSLDKGWRFHQGDIPFPVIKGHGATYRNAKAGRASGAAATDYDDTSWRILDLPHDWAIEGRADSTANLSQGYYHRGFGWYRRQFRLAPEDKGKHLELQFDGIATHATIWVNGTVLHRNWCGYTSMYIDITPYATYGDKLNTIAVRVDAEAQEGWWYEGAGIYRHTWLVKRSPLHIVTDGVFANPVKKAEKLWEIPVVVSLYNSGKVSANSEVTVSLIAPDSKTITSRTTTLTVDALREKEADLLLTVSTPELWSPDSPVLYKVKTVVKQNGIVTDATETRCGFRTIKFDSKTGFWLNDKNIKIKGICNHQDHAGVGVAVPDALWEFRLRKLKDMGVNAYRSAHNPMSKEFMAACDSMGIMVLDENRVFNTSPEYIRQLEWLIRRDRNCPSVILWSVFNEEPMQGTENGYEMVRRMYDVVKRMDATRPVTAAMNGGLFSEYNVSQAVDVAGFNYQIQNYDRFHKNNPDLPLISSEDGSAFMVRGEYKTDKSKNIMDSYDTESAGWGATHRRAWKAVAERPWMAGCFYWTGFDYHGEPTPFQWPSVASFFGIMDLCGFPKMAYYLHQAQWLKDKPVLELVPHWNWPTDSVGKPIKVMALSNADRVKLILNGKTISEQQVNPYEMNTWMVPYKPGRLEAVGYKDRKIISRAQVETTGKPVQVRLTPYRKSLSGDGRDAMPVTVEVLDAKGRHVPTANGMVKFTIGGPARIIGLGNGDPNCHESEKGDKRSLFNGLAQVIIQSTEEAGEIRLTAEVQGLKPHTIIIQSEPAAPVPSVAVEQPLMLLNKWIVSPLFRERPDVNCRIEDYDMNSWQPFAGTGTIKLENAQYVLLRTTIVPDRLQQEKGGNLLLQQVVGKAEVWLNNRKIGSKMTERKEDLLVKFPAVKGECDLRILLIGEINSVVGLKGNVVIK